MAGADIITIVPNTEMGMAIPGMAGAVNRGAGTHMVTGDKHRARSHSARVYMQVDLTRQRSGSVEAVQGIAGFVQR